MKKIQYTTISTAVSALTAIGILAACKSSINNELKINTIHCVDSPQLASGYQHIVLHNTSANSLEISLNSANDGKVYADIDKFGPGTSRVLHYTINSGRYQFSCYFDEKGPVKSPVFRVHGTTISLPYPAISPVSILDLTPSTRRYEDWINSQLPLLIEYSKSLHTAVINHNIPLAQKQWHKVHNLFETLGGAYEAFGEYGDAINASSAGLPHGIYDEKFTGIHAIEQYLFTPLRSNDQPHWYKLPILSQQLVKDCQAMAYAIPNLRIDPINMGIRAHEILENTIQFTLSGRDDYGSHATLDTIYANVQGTQQVLYFLHPILASRYASEKQLLADLASSMKHVDNLRIHLGHTPLALWPSFTRKYINALIGGLTEKLADIATITDIRRH